MYSDNLPPLMVYKGGSEPQLVKVTQENAIKETTPLIVEKLRSYAMCLPSCWISLVWPSCQHYTFVHLCNHLKHVFGTSVTNTNLIILDILDGRFEQGHRMQKCKLNASLKFLLGGAPN